MCSKEELDADEFLCECWEGFNFDEQLETIKSINERNLEHLKNLHKNGQELLTYSPNPALKLVRNSVQNLKEKQDVFNIESKNMINRYKMLKEKVKEKKNTIDFLKKKIGQARSSNEESNPKDFMKALKFATSEYFRLTGMNLDVAKGSSKNILLITTFLDPSKQFPIKFTLNIESRKLVDIDTSSILTENQKIVLLEQFGLDILGILGTLCYFLEEKLKN